MNMSEFIWRSEGSRPQKQTGLRNEIDFNDLIRQKTNKQK